MQITDGSGQGIILSATECKVLQHKEAIIGYIFLISFKHLWVYISSNSFWKIGTLGSDCIGVLKWWLGFSELEKIFCMDVAIFGRLRWEYWSCPETENSCDVFSISWSFPSYFIWLFCTNLLEIKCIKVLMMSPYIVFIIFFTVIAGTTGPCLAAKVFPDQCLNMSVPCLTFESMGYSHLN